MFKTIAGVSAALVCLTGPQIPAEAGQWDYCKSYHGGLRVCAQYRSDNDVVAVSDPQNGYIRFGVKCTLLPQSQYGWEWEVFKASTNHGYTQKYVDDFANHYCQGRLGVEAAEEQPKYSMA